MKAILGLIITNIKENIEAKRMLKKEIRRIDDVVRTLADVVAQVQKNNFREAFFEEHKKLNELEKSSYEYINKMNTELKKKDKEIKSLQKQAQK